jgi:hypothetical protein
MPVTAGDGLFIRRSFTQRRYFGVVALKKLDRLTLIEGHDDGVIGGARASVKSSISKSQIGASKRRFRLSRQRRTLNVARLGFSALGSPARRLFRQSAEADWGARRTKAEAVQDMIQACRDLDEDIVQERRAFDNKG